MTKLQKALKEYLAVRRTLGFKLYHEGAALPKFLSFLESKKSSVITTKLALCWATQLKNVQPAHWIKRLNMVRSFARYYSATDPRTEIPPRDLLPYSYHRKSPYIYTNNEILKLLKAANELKSKINLQPKTYSTLFGLIVATGMRISEIRKLDNDDVDLKQGVIIIRKTKFGKTRLLPIHPSTQHKLQQYVHLRDKIYPKQKTQSFFISDYGMRLTEYSIYHTFVQLSRKIGLRGMYDSHGPRLHDFRHTFAVKTLLHLYRTGVNVEQHLPELTTYLGHTHINYTYWYLTATPELLRLAANRLNHMKGEKLS